MAELMMVDREFDQYQRYYAEALKLIGQDAYLFPADSVEEDMYFDKSVSYSDARHIGLIFESNPRPILKRYNWLTEDEELPFLAYIAPLDNNEDGFEVRDQMKIQINSKRVISSERFFIVQKVRGSSIDPLMFICSLTPYRPKVSMRPDLEGYHSTVNGVNEAGYTYLRTQKK